MESTSIALIAAALIAAPAAVAAGGGFDGLPGAADYGMCMAGQHAHENATSQAPPFQNRTAREDCSELRPGPGDDRGQAAEDHRQDGNASEEASENGDDAGQDDAAREDGRAYGESQANDRRPDRAGPP